MEIQKNQKTHTNFYINSSVEDIVMDDIELDLSTKKNVFSQIPAKVSNPVKQEKKANPIKRLNVFDNHFLQDSEDISGLSPDTDAKKPLPKSDFEHLLVSINNVLNNILVKIPVVNYFVLKERQNKLKENIKSLNSINSDVDELINLSVPYGEQSEKYRALSENLMRANNINSQIRKEIKD